MFGAIAQHVEESFRRKNAGIGCVAMQLLRCDGCSERGRRFVLRGIRSRRGQNRPRKILGSVGFRRHTIGQPHAELRFQARQQFHAFQAAQSEIAIEQRCGIEHGQRALAAQFFKKAAQDIEDASARFGTIELCGGGSHGILRRGQSLYCQRLSRGSSDCHDDPRWCA
jgi:hypothetical protein